MTRTIGLSLALAAAFLALAAGLRFAASTGLIDDDLARRGVQVVIGLGLAAYGNLMPKQRGALRSSIRAETAAQAALRVGGWSMALAGLIYAALWAFAPLAFADGVSVFMIGGATLLTLGFAAWAFATCRAARAAG